MKVISKSEKYCRIISKKSKKILSLSEDNETCGIVVLK